MPRGTGGNTRVYLKFEDTYGTSPGGDYVQIPFKGGFDLSSEQPVERSDVLGLDREPGTGERGLIVDRGTIPAPLDLRYLGYWLKSLLGAPATSGMGPYTHVFGGSGPPTTPPSLSVLVFHPDVPRYYRHNGVVVNTITLPFSVSDRITARIEVIAKGEETVTDTAAGTPTKHALTSFARLQGSIKKDGTALGRVVGGQVAISGNLEPATVIKTDATIDGVDPGTMSANGTVTVRFAEDDLMAEALAGTLVNLTFAYTIDAEKSLVVDLPQVQLATPKRSIPGPGGIQVSFPFESETPVGGHFCTVTLTNDIASY